MIFKLNPDRIEPSWTRSVQTNELCRVGVASELGVYKPGRKRVEITGNQTDVAMVGMSRYIQQSEVANSDQAWWSNGSEAH